MLGYGVPRLCYLLNCLGITEITIHKSLIYKSKKYD
jgi:hypothetical protein